MTKIITIEDLLKNTLIGNDIKIYWSIRDSSLYRTDISNLSKRVLKRDIYTPRFHKILDLRIEYGYGTYDYDYEIFNILLKLEGVDYYISIDQDDKFELKH